MNRRVTTVSRLFVIAAVLAAVSSCGTTSKVRRLYVDGVEANLALPQESKVPDIEYRRGKRDTIVVEDLQGNKMTLMKAIRDTESGEMVANETLDAAIVTARFRNIAERRGKVNLRFQVVVPVAMQDKAWQLRFYPDMFILGDCFHLDPVIITGSDYRRAQLKGYQQYEKFLSKIVFDEWRFVNSHQLEIFLRRNIPEVYAYKTDSSYVADGVIEEVFYSKFGATPQEAVDHYTNWYRVRHNRTLINSRGKMFDKYVKVPIVTEGIRLDTVITDVNGDLIYDYVQTINTRPKLRKVDVVLRGEVYEGEKMIYNVPKSEPLTFYISSIASFADNTERYKTQVIERRAEANTSYKIEFALGQAGVVSNLGDNYNQIGYIKENLKDLLQNEVFDLDSIIVVANSSPEGTWGLNKALSQKRGEAVVRYFRDYIDDYRYQMEAEKGFLIGMDGRVTSETENMPKINFVSRSAPENWELLDRLVKGSQKFTETERETYFTRRAITDADTRETAMRGDSYYKYMKDSLYPRLRIVDFTFHLHRKGMVKDTVHTTELDERYMEGVRLLRDMDYEGAVKILGPYQDYNAALAYMGCDRNASAMLILNGLKDRTPQVNYLIAILYSRTGNEKEAVQCYVTACQQDPAYIHRGNLDPEISELIKLYNLNKNGEADSF